MHSVVMLLGSLVVLAASAWPEVASAQTGTRSSAVEGSRADVMKRFVGTWKLVAIERYGPNGDLLPALTPPAFGSPNPTGFLVYDSAGYMGMTIMQRGRQRFAGARPTPDEAKAALQSYISYCGTFSVDDAEDLVTDHVQTSLNPNNTGTDQGSFFEFSGSRLTLTPTQGADGTQARLIWERVPDLTALPPLQRRLIGFWKMVSTERRTFDGTLVRTEPPRLGFLIFTPAAHMAVHVMNPGRQKYAAADPMPEEAQQALSTYGSYFGPYEVNDQESYEVTRQIGAINPAQVGQLALRRLEFVGDNRVILQPPPRRLEDYGGPPGDGRLVQGYITWERVTPPLEPMQ